MKMSEVIKQFFMAMQPPTVTHQEKQVTVRCGKPFFYEPPELKVAREKLTASLAKYKPEQPFDGAMRLVTKWCFPVSANHQDKEWKTSKPDTDNIVKLFKDCMTEVGFWKDDAQVASEVIEKFYSTIPGIFVCIEKLT